MHEFGHVIKSFIYKEKSDIIIKGFSVSVLLSKKMKDDLLPTVLGPLIPTVIGVILFLLSNILQRNVSNLGINLKFISFIYFIHIINFLPFAADGKNIWRIITKNLIGGK